MNLDPLPPSKSAWASLQSPLGTYFARAPKSRQGRADSAVFRLMQGIWLHHPQQAQKILRSPIFTSDEVGPMDWGLVKVAAKKIERVSFESQPFSWEGAVDCSSGFQFEKQKAAEAFSDERAIWSAILKLENEAHVDVARHASDRKLAAIWIGPRGEVLASGTNRASRSRLEHAELIATMNLQAAIPAGSTLYCSLKPCRMCAGVIVQAAEDPSRIGVIYRDFDPGPGARETVLNAASFDRKRLGEITRSWPELERQAPSE